tara:strand:+ start:501 stop:1196 length:696 start_codon:yes stop_codon:yes gene_type:complete
MKYKSRAIPLHYIKLGESSIIAKILTEEIGLQSFIIKGVRKKKTKNKLVLFQPLNLIMIEGNYISKKKIQIIDDVRLYNIRPDNRIDIKKTFLWMFMSEILLKAIKESQPDKNLFKFVWDIKTKYIEKVDFNAGLFFLVNLTKSLGFYPLKNLDEGLYFDLELGQFTKLRPGQNFIKKENTHYFKKLISDNNVIIPQKNKQELILNMFTYYALHHHELKNMKSHKILYSLK